MLSTEKLVFQGVTSQFNFWKTYPTMQEVRVLHNFTMWNRAVSMTFLIAASKVPGSSIAIASSSNKLKIPVVVTLFLSLTSCTTTLIPGMLFLNTSLLSSLSLPLSLSLSLSSSLSFFGFQCHCLLPHCFRNCVLFFCCRLFCFCSSLFPVGNNH